MENLTFVKMSDCPKNVQKEVAAVFVEGYYNDLSQLNKNKEVLVEALEGSFNPDVFYLAYSNDKIIGINACSNNKGRALNLDKQKFRKHFGLIKGSIIYSIMIKEFHYHLDYPDNKAYIECVATLPETRGKGVATKLMQFIIDSETYTEYELEVTDTNTSARKIYEKMGFVTFKTVPEKKSKSRGFNERIYMKYNKNKPVS
ncbi:MAG: GNAT family N-acetyltransferase [Defluviitaleaceae bacterium]|nr:GNAT family N-acetyltransferase [Defluviitaleaceae bacterium]